MALGRRQLLRVGTASVWVGGSGVLVGCLDVGPGEDSSPADPSEDGVDDGVESDAVSTDDTGESADGDGDGDRSAAESSHEIGDRVAPTSETTVRADPTAEAAAVADVGRERRGFLEEGPEAAEDGSWWFVAFEDRPEGWLPATAIERAPVAREPLPFDARTTLNDPVDVTGPEIDGAIEALRPDSPMIGLGETFVAVQEEYWIDALYQTAHAVHESAWGESQIAQDHKNLFGWGAEDDDPYGKAAQFDSFEECIWEVMGEVKTLYLTPGDWRYHGPHLEGMNEYYATDPEWDAKIVAHYRDLAAEL